MKLTSEQYQFERSSRKVLRRIFVTAKKMTTISDHVTSYETAQEPFKPDPKREKWAMSGDYFFACISNVFNSTHFSNVAYLMFMKQQSISEFVDNNSVTSLELILYFSAHIDLLCSVHGVVCFAVDVHSDVSWAVLQLGIHFCVSNRSFVQRSWICDLLPKLGGFELCRDFCCCPAAFHCQVDFFLVGNDQLQQLLEHWEMQCIWTGDRGDLRWNYSFAWHHSSV